MNSLLISRKIIAETVLVAKRSCRSKRPEPQEEEQKAAAFFLLCVFGATLYPLLFPAEETANTANCVG